MTRVAILDYGMGNRRSVEKALEKVGAEAEITADRERVESADGVILPGVGAFPKAMGRVHEIGLDELVDGRVQAGVPVLGICLGMQLLFEASSENEGAWGLGFLAGRVDRLAASGLKIPHIGWNSVRWTTMMTLREGIGVQSCAAYPSGGVTDRPNLGSMMV